MSVRNDNIMVIGAIPEGSASFILGVMGELDPTQVSETESLVIDEGKVLHLLSARASSQPKQDANGIRNYALIEILWREVWEEETFDHIICSTFIDVSCSADFPAKYLCSDETEMVGDGVSTKLVVRRTAYGNCSNQLIMVEVRGYLI